MNQAQRFETITLNEAQREAFLGRVRAGVSPDDYRIIEGMSHALPEMLTLLEQHPSALRKLQHLLFGPKTEQIDRVCPPCSPASAFPVSKPKAKGHGRIKAGDYTGAHWVHVSHPDLKPGDPCPSCSKGCSASCSFQRF